MKTYFLILKHDGRGALRPGWSALAPTFLEVTSGLGVPARRRTTTGLGRQRLAQIVHRETILTLYRHLHNRYHPNPHLHIAPCLSR